MKPVIGITCDSFDDGAEGVRHQYADAVVQAGGIPLLLPNEAREDIGILLSLVGGLLFTGGGDIDPSHFGEPRRVDPVLPDPSRDRFELDLMRQAFERDKPTFGICRGIQVMAVALGGKLVQDIGLEIPTSIRHQQEEGRDVCTHAVRLEDGSLLKALLQSDEIRANSFHHQAAADGLPWPLRVSARAADGVVEALEAPGKAFFLGVQWHPEHLVAWDPLARKLFGGFVASAAAAGR